MDHKSPGARRTLFFVFLCALLATTVTGIIGGCYYSTAVPRDKLQTVDSTQEVYLAHLTNGRSVRFDADRAQFAHVKDSILAGTIHDGSKIKIPIDSIAELGVRHSRDFGYLPLTILGVGFFVSAITLFVFGLLQTGMN